MRLRVETGLVVVGGADSHLRLSCQKRHMEGVTQSMVDRCIVVSIYNLFYCINDYFKLCKVDLCRNNLWLSGK